MKRFLKCQSIFLLLVIFNVTTAFSQQYTVASPNGSIEIKIDIATEINYEVVFDNSTIISPSVISLTLDNGLVLGKGAVVDHVEETSVDEIITPLYGKNKEIEDRYNQLRINFTEPYSLILRADNEGVSYRFETQLSDDVIVVSEEANFNLSGTPSVIFPEADSQMQSWERSYVHYSSIQNITTEKFSITPTMFSYEEKNLRVIIAEADLFDFPGMYLERNEKNGVKGKWAHYPKSVSEPDNVYAYHRVIEREPFLAKTSGTRSYPWRTVMVTDDDKDLLTNELIYKLATPQVLTNTSYIKPGKSAWEWWHDALLESDQISSGFNNLGFPLYKVYVDFAAENKLEYITMDAGWSMDYAAEVCQYAASKNVKVFLWDFINLPIRNPARLSQIKNIGAAGVKIDLIERDDQIAINWFEQLAKDCAERELMIIFHGNAKPTGLQRKYPNIVNFEAVRGAECAKWDDTPNPDYHLEFPFIRMLAGPLDYTPGSMRNVHRSEFRPIPVGIPMTMGTRSHELAMYVLFDQPLGYLCDSPTEYRKNRVVMNFLSKVPTVWDETIPLSAKVGKYAAIAKRKNNEWYVAAMTNGEKRQIEIDFSFLPGDEDFVAEVYRDNEQTAQDAKAYTYEHLTVSNNSKVTFSLEEGGGVAIRLHGKVTSLPKDQGLGGIKLYLNDINTQLKVMANEPIHSVHIYDISGKLYHRNEISSRVQYYDWNINGLPEGVYIVNVKTASNYSSVKFLKSNIL